MNNSLTYKDLCDFALSNKVNKSFLNMTSEQICCRIMSAVYSNRMIYTTENGHITGLAILLPNYRSRILYVTHFICTTKKAIIDFLDVFRSQFSDFTLWARRHNKIIRYNTEVFIKRFYNKSLH